MQNPNPPQNPANEFWTLRRGLACFFVIILSICFSINHPKFPLSFRVPLQAYAQDSDIFAELFHVPEVFKMDYMEMERNFKIFVYPHNTTVCDKPRKLDGLFGSEGLFFENLNQSRFLTKDPDKAHLFLIPISCYSWQERAVSHVEDFVKGLISKYPYWNRTLGADHFFLTCGDISVTGTARIVHLMNNSIRVMCSPSYDVEYVPHKDVSLPHSVQPFNVSAAGNDTRERTTVAFWSGLPDSNIRENLINAWGIDRKLNIHIGFEPTHEVGRWKCHDDLCASKFCICPGGPQLDGVIAVAINYGCVPVIMSDHYDLPFNDILDWEKFSVILKESDVYHLKEILADIPKQEYEALHTNTIMVQKHFQWNLPPVRLDAFHMVMYELWLRRHVTRYYGVRKS